METMKVEEFKDHFSEALKRVMLGEEIGICHKKGKEIIAFLVPKDSKKNSKRKIGLLDKKSRVNFSESYKITPEELLGL